MAAEVASPQRIEKIMAASREEFLRGLAVLLGDQGPPELPARLALAGGHATITYDPLPAARLGGLLDLPRARVSLTFEGVGPVEAEEFLRRFDLAFQRGGG